MALDLTDKEITTYEKLDEWYTAWGGQCYVSFSGGKDSTVLAYLAARYLASYKTPIWPLNLVFVNTGLEYPEIQRFVREVKAGKYDCFNPDVDILRPEMRFDEVIKKYGYPVISKEISERVYYAKRGADWAAECLAGRNPDGTPSAYKSPKWQYLVDAPFCVSHKCCSVMKKKPAKRYERQTGRKPILGTMACESRLRQTQWAKVGCNAFDAGRPRSAPLSFWTEQDVLRYIMAYHVPYASVYGEIVGDDALITTGCDRTGCMYCMYGVHLEKEPNRFQRMKVTHPKQYAYCMDKLGLRDVLEYIGVPYE